MGNEISTEQQQELLKNGYDIDTYNKLIYSGVGIFFLSFIFFIVYINTELKNYKIITFLLIFLCCFSIILIGCGSGIMTNHEKYHTYLGMKYCNNSKKSTCNIYCVKKCYDDNNYDIKNCSSKCL